MAEPRKQTLFEAIPALGSVSVQGIGIAKLMPVGFDHAALELLDGVNRVGRDPAQNHHVILSAQVSRTHCEITVSGGKIRVRDLGSHNGTFVNGEKIAERDLSPGDKLGLSRRVTFVLAMDVVMEKPIGLELRVGPSSAVPPTQPAVPSSVIVAAPPAMVSGGGTGGGAVASGVIVAAAPLPRSPTPAYGSAPVRTTASRSAVARSTGAADAAARSGTASHGAAAPAGKGAAPAAGAAALQLSSDASVEMPAEEAEPDLVTQLRQLEQQRNMLATLYQLSLRCLTAASTTEAEQLLTNVLQRLIPLDTGFILYGTRGIWRAAICPNVRVRPAEEMVRAFYDVGQRQRSAIIITQAAELRALGLERGNALIAPLLLGDRVTGVVGITTEQAPAYGAEQAEILTQLASVAAGALRDR